MIEQINLTVALWTLGLSGHDQCAGDFRREVARIPRAEREELAKDAEIMFRNKGRIVVVSAEA